MKPLRIGIVAGENSGDILAAGLIEALKQHDPHIQFEGIAGPLMQQAGCQAIFPMEALAVMSLVEIIRHIPRLLYIRYRLYQHFSANPPDVFIGVDAPEFNLSLEKKLRRHGIKTIHYNSPKIWAWRSWRVKKIAKAVDLMLTLLPFEKKFYDHNAVKACFVGHPLADIIPMQCNQQQARNELKLNLEQPILAVLPGSRAQEIQLLSQTFLETIELLSREIPNVQCIVPMINAKRRQEFEAFVQDYGRKLPITIIDQQSHQAMAAADVVLLASGTATLEAMLLKKPMVVAYRLAPLSYWVLKSLVTVKYIALPNLLADDAIVEEFIQARANPELLARAIAEKFLNQKNRQRIIEKFNLFHNQLKQNASEKAATAVLQLIQQ